MSRKKHPIVCGDFNALECDSVQFFDIEKAELIDSIVDFTFVVICSQDIDQLTRIIRKIRTSSTPSVYLKPIFVVTSGLDNNEYLKISVDKLIEKSEVDNSTYKSFDAIHQRISHYIDLIPTRNQPKDNNFAIKILRYLFTRQTKLEPYRSSISYMGYTYPAIDFFFKKVDKKQTAVLHFLEDHGLTTGSFVDRVFNCTECYSAFIHFRELCTKCGSRRIVSQEILHHFRCAYVGPVEDFQKGDELVCPKCKRYLKLLGNDYEKPSAVFKCQDCGNSFQEPDIETVCFNCGQKSTPENLLQIDIKSYELEPVASNVVIYGIKHIMQHDIEEQLHVIKSSNFNKFLNIEVERIKRYKQFVSTLCKLELKNLNKIFSSLGVNSNLFIQELVEILNNLLRASDIVSMSGGNTFLLLLTQTPKQSFDKIFNTRGQQALKDILKNNLKVEMDISYHSVEIDGSKDAEMLLSELNKK